MYAALPRTNLGGYQEGWSGSTSSCHIHPGVRMTIDPKGQKVFTESWAALLKVRLHQPRLENRRIARLVSSDADGMINGSVSPSKGRSGGRARGQPACTEKIHHW